MQTKHFLGALFPLLASLLIGCSNPAAPQNQPESPGTAASTEARLSALSVSSAVLSPAFDKNTFAYKANVTNEIASVTVTPTALNAGATVKIEGGASLSVGENTVSVKVTAADKTTTKTYSITVTRAAANASTDASLSALSLSSGSLSPAFSTGTTSYTASVENTVDRLTVTATPTDAGATATGGVRTLAVGENKVEVLVTAADGKTTKTYTIAVTREKSSDATLASLALSAGTLSPDWKLAAQANIHDFFATVPNETSSITVTPKTSSSGATVTGAGTFALKEGQNDPIHIVVTAEDGAATLTYTLTVTRAAASASQDASLSALSIQDLSYGNQKELPLKPSFSSSTFDYSLDVGNEVMQILIAPTPTDSKAAVTSSNTTGGQAILSVGLNSFPIKVTAEDGKTVKTYTVKVTRAAPATSIAITSPAEGGTLNAGASIKVSGTWSGTMPAAIQVRVGSSKATAAIAEGGTWSATLDLSAEPDSDSLLLEAGGMDKDGMQICTAMLSVSISGSKLTSYRLSGTFSFKGASPTQGSLWIMAMNQASSSSAPLFQKVDISGGVYEYSMSGLLPGSYGIAAIYSPQSNLSAYDAYTAASMGQASIGQTTDDCKIVDGDVVAPSIVIAN